MKSHLITLLLAASIFDVISPPLSANVGGYEKGGTRAVGAIRGFEPEDTDKIRILEEDLHVRLGPKSAKIELRYRLRNETKKRVTTLFGFPVEESPSVSMLHLMGPRESIDVHSEPLYCKDFTMRLYDTPLKVKWQGERRRSEDMRFDHLAGWLVSQATLSPGKEAPLQISFESMYPFSMSSVSEDSFTAASVFKYRLSTASCWAGTIGKGRIVIESEGIDPDEVRIIKPVNRFKKEGERWIWEFTDLEPTFDDDLEIEATPSIARYSGYSERPNPNESGYVKRGERWSIIHTNYSVTASSTLTPEGERRYDAENLREWRRAWAEGTESSGVGEWLEIKPKIAKTLSAVELSPGFPEKSLFKANARPKLIRVELNDEHTFSINIPDDPSPFRIAVQGFVKPVSKIRLTFEEVWPGEQFEDLCLHSLTLHVRVDHKPEFQPAR